jgi:hypothetical protein
MKIATIRLQRNRKAKMMEPDFFLKAHSKFHLVEAAASGDDRRIYSNDQHVDAREKAWAVTGGHDIRNCSTRVGASAEPSATRRHQIPVSF